jgi:hypothetical protein
MMTGGQRGAKALTARDWLFGSRPRRLVLRFVLSSTPPERGWTKSALAEACAVSKHGGADEHIRGLTALGLLTECSGRYWPGKDAAVLMERVGDLVAELEAVPECSIDELLEDRAPPM